MKKVVYLFFRWHNIEASAAICDNTRQLHVSVRVKKLVNQKPRLVNKHTFVSKHKSMSGISDLT